MNITNAALRGRNRRMAALAVPLTLATGALFVPGAATAAGTFTSSYTFAAGSYGTQVDAQQVGLRSGPTSASGVGCTKQVPASSGNYVASVQVNPQIQADGVKTSNYTFSNDGGNVGARSQSTIAGVALGNDQLGLSITGIHGLSTTYATGTGALKAGSTFTFSSIKPTGSQAGSLPNPLLDLLNGPVNDVIDQLRNNQPIEVPGLGVIRLGDSTTRITSLAAEADQVGLEITLYGVDGAVGGGDDSVATLGSTSSRTSKASPDGILSGTAYGIIANAADGTLKLGPQIRATLPCEGTGGQVRTSSVAQFDQAALNNLSLGGVQDRVYGAQDSGGVTGWTESRIASLDLGSDLHIDAITAQAMVTRTATGAIQRHVIHRIGNITANGQSYTAPAPGQALVIPGVARIEVPRAINTATGVKVTGLRITLLSGSALNTVLNLAVTRAESPE